MEQKTDKHYMIKVWFEYIVFMWPDSLAKVTALIALMLITLVFQC